MYARLVETAQRHGAEVAACGYTSFSEEDGTVMEDAGHAPEPGFEPDAKKSCFSGESVWLRMDVVVWNKVYRRSFFEENGLRMKPGFRGGEDDIFWLTALPHASRLAVIPDQLYFYRRKRAGSLSDVWDRDGWFYSMNMDRLEYVTAYWEKIGWLESAVRQGWLAHIMKRYLLAHVTSAEEIFRRLDEEERRGTGGALPQMVERRGNRSRLCRTEQVGPRVLPPAGCGTGKARSLRASSQYPDVGMQRKKRAVPPS